MSSRTTRSTFGGPGISATLSWASEIPTHAIARSTAPKRDFFIIYPPPEGIKEFLGFCHNTAAEHLSNQKCWWYLEFDVPMEPFLPVWNMQVNQTLSASLSGSFEWIYWRRNDMLFRFVS